MPPNEVNSHIITRFYSILSSAHEVCKRVYPAVRLGSSWSGTGWHDRYWSFHRVNVTLISAGPVGGALVKTCPFTGWSAGTIRPTSGDLIRRLSTVDHGVTHHSAVPM